MFIVEALHKLKAGGMMVPKTIAAEDFIEEYSIALNGVPVHGLAVVVAKLKRGEYPNIPVEFMPLPAALAAMARAETKTIVDDLVRVRERKETLLDLNRQADVPTEERQRQVERVRALRKSFLKQRKQEKSAAAGAVHEPMDSAKAEYWSKISNLPDATEIDADQRAFRRQIENEIDAVPAPEAMTEPVTDDVAW